MAGGLLALRLAHSLQTVIALTGGVVVAVALFDVLPEAMNAVSFVLSQSGDRVQATRWLGVDSLAPLLGAIVGSSLNVSDAFLGHVLALYAGFFIYLGATDLLPEAHQHASWTRVGLTVAGFAAIFAVTRIVPV